MTATMVDGLVQPPCETSMMGVVKGAMDRLGVKTALAEAFFLSGHAFLINIHDEICPSGPYVWNWDEFFRLLPNAGIRMTHLATLMPAATPSERAPVEAKVRTAMAEGAVCSLVHLDHQLIVGHDDEGFALAQPWPGMESTPARLTYGTWAECQSGPPVTFFRLDACDPPSAQPVEDALAYAVDLWEHPDRHSDEPYAVGDGAYAKWLAAIDAGPKDAHGNWWNAVVWAECREHAADYFLSLASSANGEGPLSPEDARWLANRYRDVNRLLRLASDRESAATDKRRHVAEARELDRACVHRIAAGLKEAVA